MQPIIGCQVDLAYPAAPGEGRAPAPLVLLAQTRRVLNLMKLNSCALSGQSGQLPQVRWTSWSTMLRVDLPDGRAGRAGGAAVAGRAAPAAEALMDGLQAHFATGFMSNCSAIPGDEASPRPSA